MTKGEGRSDGGKKDPLSDRTHNGGVSYYGVRMFCRKSAYVLSQNQKPSRLAIVDGAGWAGSRTGSPKGAGGILDAAQLARIISAQRERLCLLRVFAEMRRTPGGQVQNFNSGKLAYQNSYQNFFPW